MEKKEAQEKARQALEEMVARLRALSVSVDVAKDYKDGMGGPRFGKELSANGLFLRWGIDKSLSGKLPCAQLVLATFPAEEGDEFPDFTEYVSVEYDLSQVVPPHEHHWEYSELEEDVPEEVRTLFRLDGREVLGGETSEREQGLAWVEILGRIFLANAAR